MTMWVSLPVLTKLVQKSVANVHMLTGSRGVQAR